MYYARIACTPVTDDWIADHLDAVPDLIARLGGRYVYRTTEFDSVEMPDDLAPTFMVLLEWTDAGAASAFYDDPDYQPDRGAT
jgi:uncharacterized protein (DUF1330 family)